MVAVGVLCTDELWMLWVLLIIWIQVCRDEAVAWVYIAFLADSESEDSAVLAKLPSRVRSQYSSALILPRKTTLLPSGLSAISKLLHGIAEIGVRDPGDRDCQMILTAEAQNLNGGGRSREDRFEFPYEAAMLNSNVFSMSGVARNLVLPQCQSLVSLAPLRRVRQSR